MDFQILGPITVHDATGAVALGGNKPRAVLAILLLHPNEPVSAERLALALWGEDAPGGAVKTVQVHVSRLRKALGDPAAVTTSPAGYSLRVRPGELDAERFEGLVEDARRALADGQADPAAATLREALELWRGPALAELAHEPFAAAEIARLEAQRLAALELRVEADLASGRHAEVVGELQQLVRDNPIREGLAAQLMLALYRCGRQAEALDAYAQARRTLVDELGIEPGPRLRELQEAILRQDVALEAVRAAPELPPALDATNAPPLAGRADELAWLQARWEAAAGGAGALVALTGVRGIGKTRLAAELALAVRGPGVVVLHATGEGPADAILAALRRVREAKLPTLLVVDDVDRAGAGVQTELGRLGPRLRGALVLVVACAQDALALAELPLAATLALEPLDADAVRTIATRYASGRGAAGVPVAWLVEASGGVPRRAHEVSSQWARRAAARRVGEGADRAEAGREQLRSIQDELTGDVEDLQAADDRLARAGDDDARIVCPYKGLASFDVADAPYFFGRERLVAELVARLVGAPLLGVVGPSGSGKSSVLRAGLLPALASGVLPGSEQWEQVLIRPGEHPARELAAALAGVAGAGRVVIAVDQFEETFTTCDDAAQRAEFIAELAAAIGDRDGRFVVLMALRADFYGRCADYPELAGPLAANHVLVPSMQRDELRRAIERPAERVGLRLDPELTDALVADVREEPGALPLLQTALLELWQRRDGRRMRYSVYEQSGGVRGAVARLAEDAFGQLDERQQVLARGVLMRLASEGEAGGVERRRVPLAELETDSSEELARAVALLTDRRLLTASAGSIELAHEALLREWPRLRGWVEENREGLRIHRGLGSAAREWQDLDRDEGALYRGTRLTEALEWAAANPEALNEVERRFLAGSQEARERERVTRRRRLVAAFGGLAFVLVAVAIVAIVAVVQGRATQRERDAAASRVLAARSSGLLASEPRLSLFTALAARDRSDTREAQSAVRQATLGDRTVRTTPVGEAGDFANSVALSGDRRRVVSAHEHGLVRVRDLATGRVEATIAGSGEFALDAAFNRDGTRVASVGGDGTVAITPLDQHRRHVVLTLKDAGYADSAADYARTVEYSRDGRLIAIGTSNGMVGVIRAGDGPARLRVLGRGGNTASFNPGATKVVSASDGPKATIWDVAGGAPITLEHPEEVLRAVFSPDGSLVATASVDGLVRIWNAADGTLVRAIRVSEDAVGTVEFDPAGRRIVTAARDGIVRVSSVGGGPPLTQLKGDGPGTDASFVPGKNEVVSVGEDGTLRTWSLPARAQLAEDVPPYKQPSVSIDRRHVASGYITGAVHIWNARTGADTLLPQPFGDKVEVRYSADGRYLVAASLDGSVRVWDVARRRWRSVVSGDDQKYAVAIDGAGTRVAVASETGDAAVQPVGGGRKVVLSGQTGALLALAFSPDGRSVIGAGDDATIRMWRASDGKRGRKLAAGGTVYDLAYSRDGKRIAAAVSDGTVRIWSLAGGEPVVLYGHAGAVNTVAFDPADPSRLVSAGKDGTVRVWDTSGGVSLVTVESYAGDAPGAAFSADGRRVISSGERDRLLRATDCSEVCGSFAQALSAARSRPAPVLDKAERERLLANSG